MSTIKKYKYRYNHFFKKYTGKVNSVEINNAITGIKIEKITAPKIAVIGNNFCTDSRINTGKVVISPVNVRSVYTPKILDKNI